MIKIVSRQISGKVFHKSLWFIALSFVEVEIYALRLLHSELHISAVSPRLLSGSLKLKSVGLFTTTLILLHTSSCILYWCYLSHFYYVFIYIPKNFGSPSPHKFFGVGTIGGEFSVGCYGLWTMSTRLPPDDCRHGQRNQRCGWCGCDTVDGRNRFTGFYTSQVVGNGISSIHSI